jgi:AcrR family transcriptional regulator
VTAPNDPRFLRSREAILHAARELLLLHGPVAVTHVQVAELAGVGRATVYRHWSRSDLLLAEVMATVPMPFFATPTTPIRQWLRKELGTLARELELHDIRAVATTLANTALWDPNMDARRAQFAQLLTDRLAAGLDEAQARGELTLRVDSRSAAAVTIGPLYYRSTIENAPIDDALIDAVIAVLGRWTSTSTPIEGTHALHEPRDQIEPPQRC